eukprot:scpid84330/ scgid30543/ SH2 domain-containing adapter protein F
MSSSLTRLFKKKEVIPNSNRHGFDVDDNRGHAQPNSSAPRGSDASMRGLGQGISDEYADPWDIRNGGSGGGGAAPPHLTHGNHGGGVTPSANQFAPTSSKQPQEECSYSAPFTGNSIPQSPKMTETQYKKTMNDDYQDPFDARLRKGTTASLTGSTGGGGGSGLHPVTSNTDQHRGPPSHHHHHHHSSRGGGSSSNNMSVRGVGQGTASACEYDTPVDSRTRRGTGTMTTGGGGGNHSNSHLDNYSLPADTLRAGAGGGVAAAPPSMSDHGKNNASSTYSMPRDTIRQHPSDISVQVGAMPMVQQQQQQQQHPSPHCDYSNPADHIGDIHRNGSPSRGRYMEYRGSEASAPTVTPTTVPTGHSVRAFSDSSSQSSVTSVASAAHSRQPDTMRGPPDLPDNYPPVNSQRESLRSFHWFHGGITRDRAEMLLRAVPDCSFLVRVSESSPNDYSLSVRNSGHPLHLKIIRRSDGTFVLGQNSKPFQSIIDMIQYYERHKLLIKGAEHIFLEYVIPRH